MDCFTNVLTKFLGLGTFQLRCCLWKVRELSDFIKNILICAPKMNGGLTSLEWHECVQGWIGNRAFSRWADALKGPTECFFVGFFCQGSSCRDSEQPVSHWFVSCWQRNTQSQCAIDGEMKYFAPPKERFTATSSSSAFPTFSQLYQEQACSAVSDAGQRARQEEERRAAESIKCLMGTRNRGRHLS